MPDILRPFPQPEISAEFIKAVERGKEQALQDIRDNYMNDAKPEDRMDFHIDDHTEQVIRRVIDILKTIQATDASLVSDRDIALGGLIAAYHDIVQNSQPEQHFDAIKALIKVTRQRDTGNNEQTSAAELRDFMDKANSTSSRGPLFTSNDKAIALEAHLATIPGWSDEHRTVIQPHVLEGASLITQALRLADIGAAGMVGWERFKMEGDALFRENNLDIAAAFRTGWPIDEQTKAAFKARMLAWCADQVGFATGRRDLLEDETEALPEKAKEAVRNLFSKFNDSIKGAEASVIKRENMTFEELAESMGYK